MFTKSFIFQTRMTIRFDNVICVCQIILNTLKRIHTFKNIPVKKLELRTNMMLPWQQTNRLSEIHLNIYLFMESFYMYMEC